jgi:hypothetical protein
MAVTRPSRQPPSKSLGKGRKVARQRSYDIPFVGFGIAPVTLGTRARAAMLTALGRRPSEEFVAAYCYFLASFEAHNKAVVNSSSAAIQRRIGAVISSARALQESLRKLELTDKMLFGKMTRKRFFRSEKYTELNELYERLELFFPVIEDALGVVAMEKKQGRMPAFAERALAQNICRILFEETGDMPTPKKGGAFDRLLLLAFAQIPNPTHRNDVADLMRYSLKEKPTELPEELRVLSRFRSA